MLSCAAAGLVVLLDQLTAGLGLGVGVHAERLDAERVPNRPPEEVERPQPQGPDVGDVSRSHRPPTLSRPDGPAGLLHVEGDLIDELRLARERPLVAQALPQLQPQVRAVEIAVEIEQERLDAALGAPVVGVDADRERGPVPLLRR